MTTIRLCLLTLAAALTCACSTLPKLTSLADKEQVGPKVTDITNEIQCEILRAVHAGATQPQSGFAALRTNQYVVSVNLSLDVTDNQGFNPTLSYIDPLKAANTNFTAALSAQLSGQQHRELNQTFTLELGHEDVSKELATCNFAKQNGLRGDLGIAEIIGAGLKYEIDSSACTTSLACPLPYLTPYKMTLLGGGESDPITGAAALAPNFGATVDFTVIYGLGGGPTWTLTHFTGPNPPTGGVLSAMRTNKDTLILSFARVPKKAGAAAPESAVPGEAPKVTPEAVAAGKAAQDNLTRMILQRLLIP